MKDSITRRVRMEKIKVLSDCRGLYEQEILQSILMDRGINDYDKFINPTEDDILPYESLPNIDKAVDLLHKMVTENKKICTLSDTDSDGISSGTTMTRYLRDLGIDADRCTLNGRTDDVEKEYCNSSLYVLSSRFEGFGIVLLEAMACGLPIVSFDCPWGPRSIISDRKDGLLVENGNVDALSEAMFNVISTEELRKELASSALMSVRRFQIDEIALHWKSLFEEVLS